MTGDIEFRDVKSYRLEQQIDSAKAARVRALYTDVYVDISDSDIDVPADLFVGRRFYHRLRDTVIPNLDGGPQVFEITSLENDVMHFAPVCRFELDIPVWPPGCVSIARYKQVVYSFVDVKGGRALSRAEWLVLHMSDETNIVEAEQVLVVGGAK